MNDSGVEQAAISLGRLGAIGLMGAWLTGCAPAAAPPTPTANALAAPSGLAIAVGTDGFTTGEDRVPFVVFLGSKPVADLKSTGVDIYPIGGDSATSAWHGTAVGYPDYDIPYWVAVPEFPSAGAWVVVAHFEQPDGTPVDGQFAVQVTDTNSSPQIGQAPPASRNRTLKTEPDISQLSSDTHPDPDFYQLTVADALQSGRPTVVTFATPAYCTSRMCAPVLDSVKAVAPDWKGTVNFIHIEVYKQFQPLVYADEMAEWGLTSEPWTFVIGADGRVAARLGGPLSTEELKQVLAGVVGP